MAQPPVPPPRPTYTLTTQLTTRFKPARIFKDAVEPALAPSPSSRPGSSSGPRQITSISFDDHGDQLITAADDEAFRLYNCKTGKREKIFYSKKYGIDLPRFGHKPTTIVYASTKEDDTIRYHSLHDNKYIRYFKGHKKRVVSLQVSPIDDGFMSGSEDNTVKLWDTRTITPRGELTLPATPIASYDANGVIFAVGLNLYQRINFYDTKNFDKQPFLHVHLEDLVLNRHSFPPRIPVMTSLSFSSNGKWLLVGTSGNCHYILDAYDGNLLWRLEGFQGLEGGKSGRPPMTPARGISGEEVSWTPDSKFVISGSADGKVVWWDLSDPARLPEAKPKGQEAPTLMPTNVLEGHPGASRCVKFNPRFMMMATASTELAFWMPDNNNAAVDPDANKTKGSGILSL